MLIFCFYGLINTFEWRDKYMENKQKTIAVLTSGGDAPGMNAAIRAVVRTALHRNMRVLGVRRGYNGLINGDMVEMNFLSVSDIMHRGGTILYTARCPEFREDAGVEKAKNVCLEKGIDGLVVIGGDGSYRGARDLSLKGIPCVGVPGTIDNDISSTEYTIGYDTAMNTVCEMVDRLRDTSQSHNRCSVVEVMGRKAGYIALNTGIGCGASVILLPEVKYDIKTAVIDKINKSSRSGKHHFIVMVAEGVGGVEKIAKEIQDGTGIESRASILGHVQRGGAPSVKDRVAATKMGHRAVELLEQGIGNRVVGLQCGEVVDYDILEGLKMEKTIDMNTVLMAEEVAL